MRPGVAAELALIAGPLSNGNAPAVANVMMVTRVDMDAGYEAN